MPEPMIEVIPVIDLQGSVVVRARKGLRHSYVPIVTPLSRSSLPLDVVTGLLTIHPFQTLYIADLDRIERRGSHERCLEDLRNAFPALTFWIDAGIRDAAEARAWLARHGHAHLVLGSESLQSLSVLEDRALARRTLLSLDYRGDELLGPSGIWDLPMLWPTRVIVMSLARVGTNSGLDLDRLVKIKRHAPDSMVYAAGGIRDASDLMRLREVGISGVLVASALHDGRLTAADLATARTK